MHRQTSQPTKQLMTRLAPSGNTHIIHGHLLFCYTKIKSGRREYLIFIFVLWCSLRAAGLLPLTHLVEGDLMRAPLRPTERRSRFGFDYQLVCALLDRWHPETHSFHFPWGEMAVTLEDVALLFGLPCTGEHVGVVDPPPPMCGATISSRGSPEWCVVLTRHRCLTSPTSTAPRALGCASTTYVPLSVVFS
jgi:hypothetical protein